MGISPMYVGNRLPYMSVPIATDSGVFPLTDRVPSDFRLIMHNLSSGAITDGAGSFVVTNASAGLCTYRWAAEDVANEGDFKLFVVITIDGIDQTFGPVFLRMESH